MPQTQRLSQKVEPLKISDALVEHLSRRRPDIYWGAQGDWLSNAAATETCGEERRKLNDNAAVAHDLAREAATLMKRLGVSEMPEGVWSPQI